MKIIGITGTSGSGKTALATILSRKDNVKIIDADEVVKQMSVPGTRYLEEIKNTFGEEIFFDDGSLNRKLLANKIYNDKNALNSLNNLTFKYVVDEILYRIKNIDKNEIEIIAIDAPLLFESGLNKICDFIISLFAKESLKVKRICQRDNIDEQTAINRLRIQQKDEYYIKKSDFVIYNNEDCNLEEEINKILNKI